MNYTVEVKLVFTNHLGRGPLLEHDLRNIYAVFYYTCPIKDKQCRVVLTKREGDLISARAFIKKVKRFIEKGGLAKEMSTQIEKAHKEKYGDSSHLAELDKIKNMWDKEESFKIEVKIKN